ncbi:MAG TPA: hypothetical protein VF950_15620 [Planctomycetota bacterium]
MNWRVAGPPALLSLALSILTVGTGPQWQDSTIYLTAVYEYGVLYPPGFTLYLTLCKAWTLATAPLFGFTLSVHLFSSLCVAAAAGALALAAWAVSRHVAASAAVGCLAASGYTWWYAGIYAKGYALYALIVALLLLSLIRREHRRAMVLLALGWAAHPSAALLIPAFLCHVYAHRREIGELGRRKLALTAGVALLAGLGPTLLLPLLSARETDAAMGHVNSLGRLAAYAVGKKFVEIPDVWGWSTPRVLTVVRYVWEEFLVIGLGLVALGLLALRREGPARVLGIAIWCGSVAVVTTLFKIEGQHDLWLLAAYVPLWAVAAVGLGELAQRWRFAPAAVAAAGVLWAVAANYRDVNQRGYDLVERFGAAHLRPLARDAILILGSDDTLGVCRYLQAVKGERTDVLIVSAPLIWSPESQDWYLERLRKRRPDLKAPDERPPDPTADFSRVSQPLVAQAALANANADRPVYFEAPPPPRALRPDFVAVRSGLLWKMTPKGAAEPAEDVDGDAEEVASRIRRSRGQSLKMGEGRLVVAPEPYEWRYLKVLLVARAARAERRTALRTPEGFREAAALYESILRLDRDEVFDGRCAFFYGTSLAALGDRRASVAFASALEKGGLAPSQEVVAWLQLGDRHRAEGRAGEARACYERASKLPAQDPALRAEIERRLK